MGILDIPSDKVKIAYYILEKSLKNKITNPVLYFNRNAFQSMSANDLERFSKSRKGINKQEIKNKEIKQEEKYQRY